ncbi:MAG: hypothetical protein QJT81_09450 [Candidatus Thiothrix putei]|uniref:Glycosyltransferase subfamily 4-like N-terminal domain-containing protein n=1 Tax=Candidatus Thiothrix putei TaxID=3080811 RepID=A0AA95HEX4_9GAMM|nr:MAG: hypothetical protein QJT81_09450 [Candidatus Thiothrix putei]
MTKRNLLFVSIAFPPKNDSECIQTSKYFKYLMKSNQFNIDVVTSAIPTLFMPVDESLKKYSLGVRQLINIAFFESKLINFLIKKVTPNILQQPDSKRNFSLQWKHVTNQLSHKPDIIYSRSFPLSSTIMAYYLHQHYQKPWILHLSDPWTLPHRLRLINMDSRTRKWNSSMEYKCLEAASLITFTSNRIVDLYKEHYPEFSHKMRISYNVFDTDDITISEPKDFSNTLKIVYTGGLDAARCPDMILDAIQIINDKFPNLAKYLNVTFAGHLDRRNRAIFRNCHIPQIHHIGHLSFKDSLDLQKNADILLLIDTPMNSIEESIFFPSKLLDYMLMKKRIITITNMNSTAWEVASECNLGDCIPHNEVDKLVTVLLKAIDNFINRNIGYFTIKNIDMKYSAEKNVSCLIRRIENICNG